MAKVNKTAGCWLWTAAKHYWGYGMFGGQTAHRFSWILFNGAIPSGLFVCHRCDNPPCVNPDHLFLGTPQQNMDDCFAKNREARGEAKGSSKLTESQVREMRARRLQGESYCAMAKEFGVTRGAVRHAVTGRNWSHL